MKRLLMLIAALMLTTTAFAQTYSPTYSTKLVFKNGTNLLTLIPTGLAESYTLKLPTGDGLTGQVLGLVGAADQLGWITPIADGGAAGGDLTGTYPNPTIALGAGLNIVAAINSDTSYEINGNNIKTNASLTTTGLTLALNIANANTWTATQSLPATDGQGTNLISSINASTTGTIANARTTATDGATASTIVARDASKGFSAGQIVIVDQNELRYNDLDNSNYVAIKAPDPLGGSYTLTLPQTNGSVGDVLTSVVGGVLGWSSPGSTSWGLTGNAVTTPGTNFIGTTDNQSFEIHVFETDGISKGSKRVALFEPKGLSPNITLGYQGNAISSAGDGNVILGGGGFGSTNTITGAANNSAIVGGRSNTISSDYSFVGGGQSNTASGEFSAIPGGRGLTLSGAGSFGYLGGNTGANDMTVAATNTAVFGNTHLWLANNNSTPSELRFYESYGTAGAFPNTANYVGFKAPAALTGAGDNVYTLPTDYPATTGMLLSSSTGGLLSWSTGSGLFIVNSTSLQSSANFNISGTGTASVFSGLDDVTGSDLTVRGGNGSSGAGGLLYLSSGISTGTNNGSALYIASSSASTTGAGGLVSITSGNAAGNSVNGGAITLTSGNGGGSTSNGGGITFTSGNSGSTSGNGGSISLVAGNSLTLGTGGALSLAAGKGAGTNAGGTITLTSGMGGATGNGGALTLNGGMGGSTSGNGGSVSLVGGSTTDGNGGRIFITGTNAAGTDRDGGSVDMVAGNSTGSGAGGLVTITSGNGGTSSNGGAITITAGTGGSTSGNGGTVSLVSGSATDGNGGNIFVTGTNAAGTDRDGGSIDMVAGNPTGTGAGGTIRLTSGSGGSVSITTGRPLRLFESTNSFYNSFLTSSQVMSVSYVLPTTLATAGQILSVSSVTLGSPNIVSLGWSSISSSCWMLTGNSGAPGDGSIYVGTSDAQPLYLKVNGGADNRMILFVNSSISLGKNATTGAADALAIGTNANAGGAGGSISIGLSSISTGASSISIGNAANSGSGGAITIGSSSTIAINSTNTVAIGSSAQVLSNSGGSISIGTSNVVTANSPNATAVGSNNNVSGTKSGAFGWGNTVVGTSSYAFGDPLSVTGNSSIAAGGADNTITADFASIFGGSELTLDGDRSFGFNANNAGGTASMSIAATNTAVIGNANLWLANTNGTASELRLYEGQATEGAFPLAATFYAAIKAPALGAAYTLTLPVDDGTAGQVLSTSDGTGTLAWVSSLPPSGAAGGDLAGSYPNPDIRNTAGPNIVAALNSSGVPESINGSLVNITGELDVTLNELGLNLGSLNTWTADQLLPATGTQGSNLVAAINASTGLIDGGNVKINGTLEVVSDLLGLKLSNPNAWTGLQAFTTVDINGGNIDGTAIGVSSVSTGRFGGLENTGPLDFNLGTGILHSDGGGLITSSLISDPDIAAAANIADTKLATISTAGKVSNSATTATSAASASTIVSRGADSSFSNGRIVIVDQNELRVMEPTVTGTDYVALRAPNDVTTTYSLKLPPADGVGALRSDGAGNLSWITSLPPGGTAGGDLGSTYPNPTVVAVQIAAGTSIIGAINANAGFIDAARIAPGLTNAQVNDDLTISGGHVNGSPVGDTVPSTGAFTTLKVTTSPAVGKVLTSDASGNATWQNPGQSLVYGEAAVSALGVGPVVADKDLLLGTTNASMTYFPISSTADIDLNGIVGGAAGRFITLVNTGSFTITLKDDGADTPATNNIHMVGVGNDLPVGPEGVVHLIYTSGNFWRVVGVF